MEYPDTFIKKIEWLKTLDEEELNDELNKMSDNELFACLDNLIQKMLGKECQISEAECNEQISKLLLMTREPDAEQTS